MRAILIAGLALASMAGASPISLSALSGVSGTVELIQNTPVGVLDAVTFTDASNISIASLGGAVSVSTVADTYDITMLVNQPFPVEETIAFIFNESALPVYPDVADTGAHVIGFGSGSGPTNVDVTLGLSPAINYLAGDVILLQLDDTQANVTIDKGTIGLPEPTNLPTSAFACGLIAFLGWKRRQSWSAAKSPSRLG